MRNRDPKLDRRQRQAPAEFRPRLAVIYSLLVGLAGLALLGYLLAQSQEALPWLPILILTGLSFLVQRSSFHLGSSTTHSLAGVIDIAAVLALGPLSGAIVAALSGFAYLELNALHRHKLTPRDIGLIPIFNAGLKALMALAGGALLIVVARWFGLRATDVFPIPNVDGQVLLAVAVLCLFWFGLDHLGWGLLEYFEGGRDGLRLFWSGVYPQAVLIELLPLPLGLVVALVFVYLNWAAFALLALAIVAVALLTQVWADNRNELTQRVAELSTIEQVGRAIAQAELDVDELCQLLYDRASLVVDTTIFQLGLFSGDNYVIKLWMREGRHEPQRSFRLTPGVGLVNWLRESKQPLLVRDFDKELEHLPARPVYVADRPPRSALFVPLIAGETVIGAMSIQAFRRNAYGNSDLRVLSAMADQAAVAIQKAQLFAQERKRVRQLETIGQVSRQVTAALGLDELFGQAVHLVRENFGYYHVAIFAADPERQTVTFQASASAGEQDVSFEIEWGEGLIGWVAAHTHSVIVNDVENDTRYLCVEALDGTRSEMAVPLCLEDEIVGVLDVQSDELDAFGPDDLFILETLADQVAVAIQKAGLYEAERQQAWLSTALLQVADAMGNMSDMDAVLTTTVRLTPILAGVDRCAILLWDADTETFTPTQTYGLSPELRAAFGDLTFASGVWPALDLVRWDRNPLLISSERDGLLIPRHLSETFDIREMAILPLLAQGELLGVMLVDYAGKPHPFSDRMVEMLTGIANQAAMVIQSAHLLQAQQEEAYVSMALLQVAEAVSRSTSLEEAVSKIVRITPILAGVEACVLYLWNQESDAFIPYQQYGLAPEAQASFWQSPVMRNEAVVQRLSSGQPFVSVQDLGEEPGSAAIPSQGSLLALPLVSKGDLLGIMSVDHTGSARRFEERWLHILTGIAGQAALAVENDLLLQEAAEQERMKKELEVAQRIQTSFLPECCPTIPGWELATVWRPAREVGGDFYDFFPLPPGNGQGRDEAGRTGLVIADVADKGVPAALFMALSRTLVRTMAMDGRSPAVVIAQANDLILADARSELFVTLLYAILEPSSCHICYVNAGHMPPLVVRAEEGITEELTPHGMAMGVLAGIDYEQHTLHVHPGDTLILYSDGVIEASDKEKRMFGRDRLVELVTAHRTQPPQELAQIIDESIAAFVGDADQFDDLTLVVARRTG